MADEDNLSEYNPGKFSMDLSKVEWNKENQITDETFPMYAHEYCHYIQDISSISGISGFYYKMIDIAELTKITCSGNDKTIKIPIKKDIDGYSIMKHKKLYTYYCGHVKAFNEDFIFDIKAEETTEISLNSTTNIHIPIFRLSSPAHSEILVGTYALQESHAYYVQKIIESEMKLSENNENINFKTPADSLPNYPYRFVDFLFDLFGLNASDKIKAYITELCLDTFLPMVTLRSVLEYLNKYGITSDRIQLYEIVNNLCRGLNIPLANDIQNIITEFLKGLMEDKNRDYLHKGLNWYLETTKSIRRIRNKRAYWIPDALYSFIRIKGFMTFFQPPIVIKNNQIVYFKYDHDKSQIGQDILDSVTILFLYHHIFSLTTESNLEKFNKLICCPLFENCQTRKDIKSDYVCKMTPWTISMYHKEEKKVCYYRKALIELGFEQNKIEVII